MARDIQVTYDCDDPAALAAFWAEVLGYEVQSPPEGFATWDDALDAWGVPQAERNRASAIVDPDGRGSRIFFQRVPEDKTAKNRVHIDVRSAPDLRGDERMAALEAESDRLVALGATRGERFEPDPARSEIGFIVMADPEGNEFCLD
ncbi:MAG: VOC family protein [Nocardioidaceae bacterium]|nr:VOC family protein [Nocardioidaceae bacterium]